MRYFLKDIYHLIRFIEVDPLNTKNITEEDYIANAKEMLESDEDDSDYDEDEEEDVFEDEHWNSGEMEMPDWLLQKLKDNGWKPPPDVPESDQNRLSVGKTASASQNMFKTFSEISTRSSVEGNTNFLRTLPNNESDQQLWRMPMPSRRTSEFDAPQARAQPTRRASEFMSQSLAQSNVGKQVTFENVRDACSAFPEDVEIW